MTVPATRVDLETLEALERDRRPRFITDLMEAFPALAAELRHLRGENETLEASKDCAYDERNRVVAMAARMAQALGWCVGIRPHEPDPDPTWDDDWKNVVIIDLPTGQVSWHYHDSARHLFASLPPYVRSWDGHDTTEKYVRVAALQEQVISSSLREARETLERVEAVKERMLNSLDSEAVAYGHVLAVALRGEGERDG